MFVDIKFLFIFSFKKADPDNAEVLSRVAYLVNHAKRPIIFAGQGVLQSGASDLLREFALKA